jgi:hypothetical protein
MSSSGGVGVARPARQIRTRAAAAAAEMSVAVIMVKP